MSLSEAQVVQCLGEVVEPEIGLGVVELGLVRDVRTRRGRVMVTVARPAPSYPRSAELRQDLEAALWELPGAKTVEVMLVDLNEEESLALASTLRQLASAGSGPDKDARNPFSRPGSRTRCLCISSGKGGVGKSSVTVNLAIALVARGRRVAILDADVYGFSVPRMLGLTRSPMLVGDVVVAPEAHGVRCLSTGMFVADDTPVIWRGPMLHKALGQFLADTWWSQPDYLLVDMPPGTGDVALSMSEYLGRSEVVVVTTPQPAAQRVAQRSAYMARKLRLPLRGVIENMSWFTGDDGRRYELFGSGGGQQLADTLGVPLLAQLPLVPALRIGGDEGRPVMVSEPAGEAAQAFGALAERVEAVGPARVYRRELTIHA